MIVPNHKYTAPIALQPISDEQVKALIERVLDYCVVIEENDEAAKALITLIDAVAGEEREDTRRTIALDVTAAIYARSEAFWTAAKDFAAGARAKHLTPRGTPRTRGKKQLKPGN
jgi:hypothetical protein